jgi:hypothetical protein
MTNKRGNEDVCCGRTDCSISLTLPFRGSDKNGRNLRALAHNSLTSLSFHKTHPNFLFVWAKAH